MRLYIMYNNYYKPGMSLYCIVGDDRTWLLNIAHCDNLYVKYEFKDKSSRTKNDSDQRR